MHISGGCFFGSFLLFLIASQVWGGESRMSERLDDRAGAQVAHLKDTMLSSDATYDRSRNMIAFDPIQVVVFSHLYLSYERISKHGKSGLRIPFSAGIFAQYFALGLDYKSYFKGFPNSDKRLKYFIGPSILGGINMPDAPFAELKLVQGLALLRGRDMIISLDTGIGPGYDFKTKKVYFGWHAGISFGGRY